MKPSFHQLTLGSILAAALVLSGTGFSEDSQPPGAGEKAATKKEAEDAWKGWHKTWKAALAASKTSKKPVFILFTGSTWCAPCMAMEKNVINTEEFRKWGENFELAVHVFPGGKDNDERDKAVQKLQAKLAGDNGVPNWAFCRPDGTVIGRNGGYNGQNAAAWIQEAAKQMEGQTGDGRAASPPASE